MKKLLIIALIMHTLLNAADKEPFLPSESYDQFSTPNCLIRRSTIFDYSNVYDLFSSKRARFQFAVELSEDEQARVAASWTSRLGLLLVASNWFPSLFGTLMIVEKKEDGTFLGTCSIKRETHEPILSLLEGEKKYMNMGMCLNETCKDKNYSSPIASKLINNVFNTFTDISGIVVSCNERHPILVHGEKLDTIYSLGFEIKGVAYFPKGLTSLVPQKEVRMVTFALERGKYLEKKRQ